MRLVDRSGLAVCAAAIVVLATLISGCKPETAGNSATSVAGALAINGTPPANVLSGEFFAFQPTVMGAGSAAYGFSVSNKPAWMALNTATGLLTGTPGSGDVGVYPNIVLNVTSARGAAALLKFAVAVRDNSNGGSSLTISGQPAAAVSTGNSYYFMPSAKDLNDVSLVFSVQGLPNWAHFEPTTGLLTGTPAAAEVGTYSNIVITVSDGIHTASMPAFSIAVVPAGSASGSATLSWTAPITNADGTPLTDLSGYRIYYGNSATTMTQLITINTPGLTNYVIGALSSGTWYFALKAYNSANVESNLSPVLSASI